MSEQVLVSHITAGQSKVLGLPLKCTKEALLLSPHANAGLKSTSTSVESPLPSLIAVLSDTAFNTTLKDITTTAISRSSTTANFPSSAARRSLESSSVLSLQPLSLGLLTTTTPSYDSPISTSPMANSHFKSTISSAPFSLSELNSIDNYSSSHALSSARGLSSSTTLSISGTAVEKASSYALQGHGITYSPYQPNFQCKSHTQIAEDLVQLRSFALIRLYSPDCDCVSGVLAALLPHQQIFAGLFYMNSIDTDMKLLVDQVKESPRGWDAIYAVSIGNEWLNDNTHTLSDVLAAIAKTKSLLTQNGYNGPLVSVDTVPAYLANPTLCDAVDFVAVNSHAYWAGNVSPKDSGTFLQSQISQLSSLCGKNVLITETGWPTQGKPYGSAVPGTSQQLACIKSIAQTVSSKVIFFTVYNDFWKAPGPYGVEQYWGLF